MRKIARINENGQLSLRLKAVSSLINEDSVLLDIGTDHAYLPIELSQKGKISHAFAGEVAKGPFNNAQENIKKFQLNDKIDLFLGTGFSVVNQIENPTSIDVITICGMGGQLIADIIQDGCINYQIPRSAVLILQPNNQEVVLREKLIELGYDIVTEKIIKEQEFYYEIIKAVPTDEKVNYSEEQLFFGPILLEEKNDVFMSKWKERLNHFQKIENELKLAKKPPVEKMNEIQQIISRIQKVIQ